MKAPTNPPTQIASPSRTEPASSPLRERLWRIIFLSDTRAGRAFDVVLLWVIGISVLVVALVCVEGTLMYLLEHMSNPGFNNIPQSIYWAIVTITTVGYGDLTPVTVLGKMMASVIMLTGFAILAVPTGIVSAELGRELSRHQRAGMRCTECGWDDHDARAQHCQQCGANLSV